MSDKNVKIETVETKIEDDVEINEDFLRRVNRVKLFNYFLMFLSFVFSGFGLVSFIQFKLQYGEIHQLIIGEWIQNSTSSYYRYSYSPDYAYTRLIVCFLFAIFLFGIALSNDLLKMVSETVKEMLDENNQS